MWMIRMIHQWSASTSSTDFVNQCADDRFFSKECRNPEECQTDSNPRPGVQTLNGWHAHWIVLIPSAWIRSSIPVLAPMLIPPTFPIHRQPVGFLIRRVILFCARCAAKPPFSRVGALRDFIAFVVSSLLAKTAASTAAGSIHELFLRHRLSTGIPPNSMHRRCSIIHPSQSQA